MAYSSSSSAPSLHLPLPCPHTGHLLCAAQLDGLSFKCRFCRRYHVISWQRLEEIKQEIQRLAAALAADERSIA